MAKIYRNPLLLSSGIKAQIEQDQLVLTAGEFKIMHKIHPHTSVDIQPQHITIDAKQDSKESKKFTSTLYALTRNSLTGLTQPFTKTLRLVGVGFKGIVNTTDNHITFSINLSHPLVYALPKHVTAVNQGQSVIVLSSHDKDLLGKTCSTIRGFRPPEVYKGKGIRYVDENIVIKTIKKR